MGRAIELVANAGIVAIEVYPQSFDLASERAADAAIESNTIGGQCLVVCID